MQDAVDALLAEHAELERRLADPAVHTDQALARRLARRYAELTPVVAARAAWLSARDDVQAARELAADDQSFADELPALTEVEQAAADHLRRLLVPRDPDDDRDVILEVKAGEGGEESALFAGDLLRMYLRFAERSGWSTQVLDATESDLNQVAQARPTIAVTPLPPKEMLAQLFGFTAAEMRVAERLLMGDSPEQVAAFLNVKTATARWHLASIYRKTGTNRQAELVRLLLSLAMM